MQMPSASINKLCVAAMLCSAVTGVQAAAPAWQRIELGAGSDRYPFAIYSNKQWSGDMSRVRAAVLVFHGASRNGDDYYAAAEKLLVASGASTDETLLIAPNFFARVDAKKHPLDGMPLWEGERGWNGGWDAANWLQPLSSFRPIDDILGAFLERSRFPRLERIIVAGHSGGGQIVHRYAVLNNVDEKIRAAGRSLRYVVANPSSYLYFTPERAAGDGFAPPDAAQCPGYDEYKYGMGQMVRYADGASGAELFRRHAVRDVTYLLGTSDNDPNHRSIDKSCAARSAGSHRLERGRNYIRYEHYLAGSGLKLNRRAYEVVDVGHNQAQMFASKCGALLLFGMPEEKNSDGAICRPAAL